MPPKKYKNNNESKSQPEAGEEGENVAENEQNQEKTTKNTQPFKCACGKTYGSLAAVHTHINNKHPLQKKKFKAQIINPKKSGQIASTSIRMKDINFNESEAQLMCHADINLKAIYQYYCEVQKNLKDNEILIEINDELSDDSGIDIQGMEDNLAVKVETKKRKEIIKTLKQLQETFKMGEIINTQKEHKDLQTFKIQKFKLNLITQLSKFFNPKFAAKIEFSLYLIHAYQKAGAQKEDMKAHIDTVLQQLWKINTKIKDQLFRYYREWNRIRYDYKNWKYQQIKNEKNAT